MLQKSFWQIMRSKEYPCKQISRFKNAWCYYGIAMLDEALYEDEEDSNDEENDDDEVRSFEAAAEMEQEQMENSVRDRIIRKRFPYPALGEEFDPSKHLYLTKEEADEAADDELI